MNKELLVCGQLARDVIFGREQFGGCAAAIAINAARMGISSGLVSVIGKDQFSQHYMEFLQENNIDIELIEPSLEVLPECRVSNAASVEWVDNGSHSALETINVKLQQALNYSAVHLVSCPPRFSTQMTYLGINNLSFEPGPYIHIDSTCLDFSVVVNSRLLFFNENEFEAAKHIAGTKSPLDFIVDSSRVLIVTRGNKGSDVFTCQGTELINEHVDAISLQEDVVDSTGAGDCYKAGFLTGYIRGRTFRDCALIGSYMGAACVTTEGGILPSSKTREIRRQFKI